MKLSSLPIVGFVLTAPFSSMNPAPKEVSDPSELPISPTPNSLRPLVKRQRGIWGIFSSTFLTIFLAEIGDKTQLATLLISAESQSPWIVFTGAAIALITTSLIGVLLGTWLAKRLPPKTLETAAGTLLLFISVMLLWDVVQLG